MSNDHNNSRGVFKDLRFIQKQSRYADNLVIHSLLVEKIVRSGIGHVFLRLWGKLIDEDYLGLNDVDCGYHGESASGADHIDNNDNINNEHNNKNNNDNNKNGKNNNEGIEDSFRSLQMLLSIVWNCTDSSVSLCESLVSSASIYQILSELSKPQLITFDTLSSYNEYL